MRTALAIAWLHYRLLRNRLHTGEGITNLIGAIVITVGTFAVGIGLAILLGVSLVHAQRGGPPSLLLKIELLALGGIAVLILFLPVFAGTGRNQAVTPRLLAYPIGRRKLYWISLAANTATPEQLLSYPMLITFASLGVILPGNYSWLGLLTLLSFWCCCLVWGHGIRVAVETAVGHRRGREILGFLVVLVVMLMAVIPRVLDRSLAGREIVEFPLLASAVQVLKQAGRVLPPALAANALADLRQQAVGTAVFDVAAIWAWIIPAALVDHLLFSRLLLGERGSGRTRPRRKQDAGSPGLKEAGVRPSLGVSLDRLVGALGPEIRASAAKEWKYLLRSLRGRSILLLTPLLVGFFGLTLVRPGHAPVLGYAPEEIGMYGTFLYVLLLTNSLATNNLSWDGCGAQSYFIVPAPLHLILLGKNLAHWCHHGMLLIISLTVLAVLGRLPGGGAILSGALLFTVVVIARTTYGNVLSLLYPRARGFSTLRDQLPAANLLLGLVGLGFVAALTWVVSLLSRLTGYPMLEPFVLLVVLLVCIGIYGFTLESVARLLTARRERIVEALRERD